MKYLLKDKIIGDLGPGSVEIELAIFLMLSLALLDFEQCSYFFN